MINTNTDQYKIRHMEALTIWNLKQNRGRRKSEEAHSQKRGGIKANTKVRRHLPPMPQ